MPSPATTDPARDRHRAWNRRARPRRPGRSAGRRSKCLDARGGSSADGTAVQMYACNGTGAQTWSVDSDQSLRVLGKCLDVVGGGTGNGAECSCGRVTAPVRRGGRLDGGSLQNPQSGRCLDVPGGVTADGSQVQIWDCNGSAAQRWTVPTSVLASGPVGGVGSKCLDVRESRSADGTAVQTFGCNGTAAQAWSVHSDRRRGCWANVWTWPAAASVTAPRCSCGRATGRARRSWARAGRGIANPQSGRCLDVPGGVTADGLQVQIWDCNGSAAQRWTVPTSVLASGPVGGVGSKCLDVRESRSADGTAVQTFGCNGTAAQAWSLHSDQSARALGKCLDVAGGGVGNGTKVQLWSCNGSGAQVWQVQGAVLRNPQSGRCLDVPGGVTADGLQVQIWDCNGSAAQRWTTPGTK